MPVVRAPMSVRKFNQRHRHTSKSVLRQHAQYSLVLSYIASAHLTKPEFLLGESRGSKHLSDARHITNYLAHVVYGMTYTNISKIAARDCTSIAHGCGRVEDQRDAPQLDRVFHFAELALQEFFNASWEVANDDDE